MKRKVNMNYEFTTSKGNCFIIETYKCNGYTCDIFRKSTGIDGEKLIGFFDRYMGTDKSIFFMGVNNYEVYLENNY